MDPARHPAARHAFDFLYGRWTVRHHRLDRRLVGDGEWTDFDGTAEARPLLGGLGNIDDNVLDLPSGRYEAVTLRLHDAALDRWSIWWIDARSPGIGAPVHGSFVDGVGTFHGDDVHDGRPVRVRFVWSDITRRSAHWAQAFSIDGGATWETNWTMQLERVA